MARDIARSPAAGTRVGARPGSTVTPSPSGVPTAVRSGGSISDAVSGVDFASAVTAITSAFGDPTRRDIYLYARALSHEEGDGLTAAEVAERFELHPNVARHHLEKLAGGGYLEVSAARSGTGLAGRPSKRYRVSGRAMPLDFPVRHDDLLVTLLGKALARLPVAEAEAMAEEVGAEYGRAMAGSVHAEGDPAKSFRSALHTVADALTAHGFAAHAESRSGQLRIVSEHCPFGDAAIEHPVICAVDRGMVRGMLGALYGDAATATEASVARGDAVCVTSVE
ncbi:MAG: helix-turn-helix domain-containing protein [Acidimicrobiia bacterium]|nr:helix-turn-helix domain-containing protein [Acidimicrobiia bacterium]